MLRLGIVDFDSSHAVEFTRRFNHVNVDRDQYVEGARVVMGWPGESQMAPERIAGFTPQVQQCGVQLAGSAEEMIGHIDAVLVLSLCGSAHLEHVRPFLAAGVPAFVDKPFACCLSDALSMVRLAEEQAVLLFSSSALRFAAEVQSLLASVEERGAIHGVFSYGPAGQAAGNPGLFHYGIHATELLFALMGPGCESVTAVGNQAADVVTGIWADGRFASLRGGRRGATVYGFAAFCEHGVVERRVSTRYAYRNLCRAIVESMQTGQAAVSHGVTLEIVRFILAAAESRRRSGEPVALTAIESVQPQKSSIATGKSP